MNEADDSTVKHDLSSSDTGFQPGELIDGRYEVIGRLGRGGMGLVYQVRQVLVNSQLALKTINKHCISDSSIRRFQQEAKTVFSLSHPNIISVKDFGILKDNTPFLVMELLHGETLSERLKRTGALNLAEALPIFLQICSGLEYAHECGIVHRDVKPSNIMLLRGLPQGTEGSIKLLDFGIAKFSLHEGGEVQALTRTGEIFGSPLYMSPEQCGTGSVDHRSDIYSLGCVFYEVLTGAPPFVGENALGTMMMHQNQPASSLKEASLGLEFPQPIEDIIMRMLAKSPANRYQSVGSLSRDLAAFKSGGSASRSHQVATKVQQFEITQREFYAWLTLASIASATVGVVCTQLYERQHQRILTTAQTQTNSAIDAGIQPEDGDKVIKATDEETEKYKNSYRDALIKSVNVNADGKLVRKFVFPRYLLGLVSTRVMNRLGTGKIVEAYGKDTVFMPVGVPLSLELRGRALDLPFIINKIDANEFVELVLSGKNKDLLDSSLSDTDEITRADNVAKMLASATSWNRLENIAINELPINQAAINALSRMPHLKALKLNALAYGAPLFNKQLFLTKLEYLELSKIQHYTMHDILKSLNGSPRLHTLVIQDDFLSAPVLEPLSKCANLSTIRMKAPGGIDMSIISALERIKGLRTLKIEGISLTAEQRQSFQRSKIDVR